MSNIFFLFFSFHIFIILEHIEQKYNINIRNTGNNNGLLVCSFVMFLLKRTDFSHNFTYFSSNGSIFLLNFEIIDRAFTYEMEIQSYNKYRECYQE
jgi:hypothetical protein